MDLERAETFTGLDTQLNPIETKRGTTTSNITDEVYQLMGDDGIIDEDVRVDWPVFITRLAAFFLFLLIVIFCALEEINIKFLALAAIVCILLIVIFVATYVDIWSYCRNCCSNCFRRCCTKRAAATPSESDIQRVLRYSGNGSSSSSSSQAILMRSSIPR